MTAKRCDECGAIHGAGNVNTLCPLASNYRAGRSAASIAGPSLAQLVDAQRRLALISLDDTALYAPLTAGSIATIAYALGVLSAERLAAGERLDDGKGQA